MIEACFALALCLWVAKVQVGHWVSEDRRIRQGLGTSLDPLPGLSSQAAQIKPLTPDQVALGKRPYLGPRRKRKVKIPKRRQST